MILDPKALNDEGLSRDSKVSLTANSIKLKTALKFMLRPLGLTYKAEDDVLLITSPQASRDKTYPWTYPVADLVIPPNKADAAGHASRRAARSAGTDPAVAAGDGAGQRRQHSAIEPERRRSASRRSPSPT